MRSRFGVWRVAVVAIVALTALVLMRLGSVQAIFAGDTAGSISVTARATFAGGLWTWGKNLNSQLALGDTANRSSPTRVGGLATWKMVADGEEHGCATRTDQTLWCWGYNSAGQLGIGNQTTRSSPVQVTGSWTSVAASWNSTCAIRDTGTLWCWGSSSTGKLGISSPSGGNYLTPQQVGSQTWRSVSAGPSFGCGIQTAGSLWCWGSNANGQLGNNNTGVNSNTPVQVGSLTNWTNIIVGNSSACALAQPGTLWCWGNNGSGEVGQTYSGGNIGVPTRVLAGSSDWLTIAEGYGHVCGIRTPGTLWCWGSNTDGQVGNGSASGNQIGPVQVGSASTWYTVGVGRFHSCALRNEGTLWCWGRNTESQLGTADTTARTTPTQIGSSTDWFTVGTGSQSFHSAGIL